MIAHDSQRIGQNRGACRAHGDKWAKPVGVWGLDSGGHYSPGPARTGVSSCRTPFERGYVVGLEDGHGVRAAWGNYEQNVAAASIRDKGQAPSIG